MTYKIKSKKPKEKKESYAVETSKPVNIQEHNFSWEEENGKVKVSLGNMSDAGWYWNGTDKEFIGFLHRLENSEVKDEFLEEAKGINFDKKVKPYLYKSAKTKDGLYEMSGDNVRWHFGQDLMDSYDLKEEEGLTEEQEKEFWVQFNGLTYEKFQRKYGKQYQQDIDKAISESHSFKEFMDKTNELKEEYNEYADEETMNEVRETINKIGKK
jgi:hypothetical protein